MKMALCAALAAASTILAPTAAGTPCQGVINQSGCNPAPWNGQQMDTWNIPNSYGGWVHTPIMCDPQTAKCAMWAQP